jgi:lipopolysaccharide biosynthesis protein
VRRNEGYDFAAWAHLIRKYPEFTEVDILYLVNDSVVGPLNPASFSRAIGRIRSGCAQVYGMTENFEKGWHLQSYFLAIKQAALKSSAFVDFFDSVEVMTDKGAVIDSYEVAFAATLAEAGFRTEALFTVPSERNPTIYYWRELVESGFPFVKVQVGRDQIQGVDREAVREYLKNTGYCWDGTGFCGSASPAGASATFKGSAQV